MAKKLPKLIRHHPQIQESQRTSSRINTKTSKPRHHILKLHKTKHKEKILRKGRGWKPRGGRKYPIYRPTRLRIIENFSWETKQVRKEWSEIFKVLKKRTNLKF